MSSTPGAKMGDAFIGVTVDAAAVGPELEAQVDTALAQVVETADAAMTKVGVSAQEAAAKVAEAFDGASKAQQDAFLKSSATAEAASARVVAAQVAQVEAINKVAEAQKVLDAARAEGNAEAAAAAEASLASAMGKSEVAAAKVTSAVATEAKAKADLTTATEALGVKEEEAGVKSIAAAEGIQTKWMGMASLVGGVAVVALAKTAGDYQQTLTKLATTAGESTTNLKLVGDGMLQMAGDVGISAQHLSEGMYTVESAGFHGADGLTVLKAAAQGAKQENADLEKVTDAVTTALHDYNLPASSAATVTSQLVDAVAHGKTTFDALTGSMHSVTPLAASMGMSLADTAGALSAMTASGMSADQATQNMADALRHLQSPTQPMINQLAQLGIRATDLSANLGKKGLAGTMQEIEQAVTEHLDPATKKVLLPALNQSKEAANDLQVMLKQMPAPVAKMSQGLLDGSVSIAEYTKQAKALGGTAGPMATQFLGLYKSADGFSNILKSGSPAAQTFTASLQKAVGTAPALSVALQLTGEHAAAANQAIKDIGEAVPEADGSIRGWSEVQGNFNQKLSETGASLQSWAVRIGQDLLPAATKIVGVVQSIVEWLTKHKTIADALVVAILGIATAWAAIKIGNGVAKMAGDFKDAGEAIAKATGKLIAYAFASTAEGEASRASAAGQLIAAAATRAWGLAMDALPIIAIVAGIALLVAGVIYAWNHFAWFKDAVHAVGEALTDAGHWFVWLGGVIGSALGVALDWVKTHWPLLLELLAGPIGWFIAIWTNFGPQILHGLEVAGAAIGGWISTAIGWLASLPGKAGDALVTFGPKVAAAIGTGLVAGLGAIVSFISYAIGFFISLPIRIAIVLFVLGEKIGEAFIAAFEYLKTNIPIWFAEVVAFFAALPGQLAAALTSLGTSLWTSTLAGLSWLGTQIHDWWDKEVAFWTAFPGQLAASLSSLGNTLWTAAGAALAWLGTQIHDWWDKEVAFWTGLPGRIADSLSSLGSKLAKTFTDALQGAKDLVSRGVTDIVNFVKALPGDLADLAGDMLAAGSKLISSFLSGLAHVGSEVASIGKAVANAIIGFINTHVIDSIDSALNFEVMGVSVHAGVIPHIPQFAQGGVVDRPTLAIVGEDGPEAIVPLTKPGRAAAVMGQAGLAGDSKQGGGVTLNVTNHLDVARQATAEEIVAQVSARVMRSIRLGDNGALAGLGMAS